MTTIFSVLAELNAAYLQLSRGWRWFVLLLVVVVVALAVRVTIDLFVLFILRALKDNTPAPEPVVDYWHDTWCRSCRAYAFRPTTICPECDTPLHIFTDPIAFAEHMAQTYPLPSRKFSTPAAKGFSRKDAAVFLDQHAADRQAHLRMIQRRPH